jgi:DEAD/DEAH box helicase domain-containing protein
MGFHRIWHGSGQVFDTVDLFLPDMQFPTQARVWTPLPMPRTMPLLYLC